MEELIGEAECGKEVLVEVESGAGSASSTTWKPNVAFHEVLADAVHRIRDSPKDRLQHSSWKLVWARAKFRLMHPPDEQCHFSGLEEDDDRIEDFPKEMKIKFNKLNVLNGAFLVLIVLALVCTVSIPDLKRRMMWDIAIWEWEILLLALVSGRLISGWGVWLAAVIIEYNFLLHKRVLYFVYGLKRDVQNCIWFSLVLQIWYLTFDGKVAKTETRVLPYVTKILVCLLVASVIWLFKTLIVKLLAVSFHVKAYFERIDEAIFNLHMIKTLSEKPLKERHNSIKYGDAVQNELKESLIPKRLPSMVRKDDVLTRVNHLRKRKPVSAWHMMKMIEIIRHGTLATLDDKILDVDANDEYMPGDRWEHEAKIVAKRIFHNAAQPGARFIYIDDLRCFFVEEDQAVKVLKLFGATSEHDGVDKNSLRNGVIKAFRDRNALALSLNDTNTAVDDLHNMLNVVMAIAIAVIWLIILGVPVTQFLVFISSQILLAAFVFGDSCKTAFQAIIFLFVMHPYDVGDLCEVDGVQLIVKEMNILTTVFVRKNDNMEIRYPNSILATKPISNYNRSPPMIESIEFFLHISTPMDKVHRMTETIKQFVEKRSDHWHPAPRIVMKDLEDMNKIIMTLWVQHRISHHDVGERWARRAVLIERMIEIFKQLEIEYRMLPLDVNVRNLPSPSSATRLPSNWTACAY